MVRRDLTNGEIGRMVEERGSGSAAAYLEARRQKLEAEKQAERDRGVLERSAGYSFRKSVATRRASPHNAMSSERLALGSPQCKQPDVALLVLASPALSSA